MTGTVMLRADDIRCCDLVFRYRRWVTVTGWRSIAPNAAYPSGAVVLVFDHGDTVSFKPSDMLPAMRETP